MSDEGSKHPVKIVYTNYRHQTAVRTIVPERVWFGSTEWHPEPQWLLEALDVEKGERRSFAMADIKCWFHDPVTGGGKPDVAYHEKRDAKYHDEPRARPSALSQDVRRWRPAAPRLVHPEQVSELKVEISEDKDG